MRIPPLYHTMVASSKLALCYITCACSFSVMHINRLENPDLPQVSYTMLLHSLHALSDWRIWSLWNTGYFTRLLTNFLTKIFCHKFIKLSPIRRIRFAIWRQWSDTCKNMLNIAIHSVAKENKLIVIFNEEKTS